MAAVSEHELFLAPGELLLAATGITVAIRPGPVRVNQAVIGKADPYAMAKAIRRRLKKFLVSPGWAPVAERPPFDYDEICDLLPQMESEARNVENVAGFREQFLADSYAEQLGRAVGYVKREIPDKIAPLLVGGQRLRASDHDVSTFKRRYQVLDRPLLVLEDLSAGWLMEDQVDALSEVFPAIYGAVLNEIMPALVDAAGTRQNWRLSYEKDLQLGILMRESKLDGQLHAQMLELWEEQRAKESGTGPAAPQSKSRKGIGDPSTQQERLEAR